MHKRKREHFALLHASDDDGKKRTHLHNDVGKEALVEDTVPTSEAKFEAGKSFLSPAPFAA